MAAFSKTAGGTAWKIPGLSSLIPNQAGRRIVITGANSGIGYPAARELARAGASVVLAARDRTKAETAIARLRSEVPGAKVEVGILDLASLASVRDFAARELDRGLPLDVLVDNAGVMGPPKRLETKDGFELQFGTNVLGHFALTGLLMPAIEGAIANSKAQVPQSPRVVFLASIAHKQGSRTINFDDLQAKRSYGPMQSYRQSKLADLMLSFELDRRLKAKRSPILSIAAHPESPTQTSSTTETLVRLSAQAAALWVSSSTCSSTRRTKARCATIYAAVAPEAQSGGYYGPKGFQEMRGGDVGDAIVAPQAQDKAAAAQLWTACEELTGVRFP